MICFIIMVDVVNERRVRQRLRCVVLSVHSSQLLLFVSRYPFYPTNLATLLWTYSSTRSCNLQTSCLLWDPHHSDKTEKAPKNHFTHTTFPLHHIIYHTWFWSVCIEFLATRLVIGLIPEYSGKKVLLFKVFSKHTLAALNKTATKAYPHPFLVFLFVSV